MNYHNKKRDWIQVYIVIMIIIILVFFENFYLISYDFNSNID